MAYDIIETNNVNFVPPMIGSKNLLNPFTVNSYSILSVPAVWRAVDLLATNLASFPRAVYDNGAKKEQPHPLDTFLKLRPNNRQNPTQFWTQWFFKAVHRNRSFAKIVRDGSNVQAYNLDPDTITPFLVLSDPNVPESAEQWYWDEKYKRVIPAFEMLTLYKLSDDGLVGIDTVELHRDTFHRAKMYDRFATKYLEKGTRIRGWVKLPGTTTKEQKEEIINTLRRYRGSNGEDDIAIMAAGAELHNDTISPEQSQLTEQVQASNKQIGQLYGVPPAMLFEGSETKYNDNTENMGEYLVRFTFRPFIEAAQDELTSKLLTTDEQDRGLTIRLDTNALLKGNVEAQTTVIAAQVAGGLRTENEGRGELGLPRSADPSADVLKRAGDTSPASAPAAPPATASDGPTAKPQAFAALIRDAADRVERKSEKGLTDASTKTEVQRIAWGNVFADQQAKYVRETFAALAQTLKDVTGASIDVGKLSEQYSMEVKRRVSGQEPKSLADYVGEYLNERSE